jgi:hypothetical protein
LDVFETSARILSVALEGTSRARITALHPHLKQDEVWWLLEILTDRNLLEIDSSTCRSTVDGVKFLEIWLNMGRMLEAKKSLV